jgi:hypothetical protein
VLEYVGELGKSVDVPPYSAGVPVAGMNDPHGRIRSSPFREYLAIIYPDSSVATPRARPRDQEVAHRQKAPPPFGDGA